MTKKKPAKRKTMKEQIKEEVQLQVPKVVTGVAVALPNTIEQKMEAICDLAEAVGHLARALASTSIEIRITDCHISNVERGIDIRSE